MLLWQFCLEVLGLLPFTTYSQSLSSGLRNNPAMPRSGRARYDDVRRHERRLARNGQWYTFATFVSWYGQTRGRLEWERAPSYLLWRMARDGRWYYFDEFVSYYGDERAPWEFLRASESPAGWQPSNAFQLEAASSHETNPWEALYSHGVPAEALTQPTTAISANPSNSDNSSDSNLEDPDVQALEDRFAEMMIAQLQAARGGDDGASGSDADMPALDEFEDVSTVTEMPFSSDDPDLPSPGPATEVLQVNDIDIHQIHQRLLVIAARRLAEEEGGEDVEEESEEEEAEEDEEEDPLVEPVDEEHPFIGKCLDC